MQLEPNLHFSGNARSALEHYQAALGGELEIVPFAQSPAAEFAPPDWGDKVLYGTLRSPLGTINAMDAPPERAGTSGDNFSIGVQADSDALVDSIFAKLAAEGRVIMPLAQTFWSPKFGMLSDKFGIKWMVNRREADPA